MKKLEKWALLFIAIAVFVQIYPPIAHVVAARVLGISEYQQFSTYSRALAIVHSFMLVILNVAIGIALFVVAKRDKNTPWVWLLLGIFFGLLAPIFYYIVILKEEIEELKNGNG